MKAERFMAAEKGLCEEERFTVGGVRGKRGSVRE